MGYFDPPYELQCHELLSRRHPSNSQRNFLTMLPLELEMNAAHVSLHTTKQTTKLKCSHRVTELREDIAVMSSPGFATEAEVCQKDTYAMQHVTQIHITVIKAMNSMENEEQLNTGGRVATMDLKPLQKCYVGLILAAQQSMAQTRSSANLTVIHSSPMDGGGETLKDK